MQVPLSVLTSPVDDGSLVWSVSLLMACQNLDHPTRGLLIVGDGIISMEGSELGSSTLSSPSSQSKVKHQQHVSPHLSQYSQCLLKNFVSHFTSPLDSVWVNAMVCMGSVNICGGYLNPEPAGISVSEASSSVCKLAVLWDVLPFLDFI